ncbi:MAG: DUF3995 domain-containing protein [Maritimibacter sp.]
MNIIAGSILVILAVTGAIHALWALRIWWPIADEEALARAVVGAKGITRMPSAMMTWVVVVAIVLGILWTMALSGWIALPLPDWMVTGGGLLMAAVLLVRGIGTYFAGLFGMKAEEPFSTLNARYYSPVIILLGVGTLLTAVM